MSMRKKVHNDLHACIMHPRRYDNRFNMTFVTRRCFNIIRMWIMISCFVQGSITIVLHHHCSIPAHILWILICSVKSAVAFAKLTNDSWLLGTYQPVSQDPVVHRKRLQNTYALLYLWLLYCVLLCHVSLRKECRMPWMCLFPDLCTMSWWWLMMFLCSVQDESFLPNAMRVGIESSFLLSSCRLL